MLPLLLVVFLQDPYVRVHDGEVRTLRAPGARAPVEPGGVALAHPPVCDTFAAGAHGEPVPGGGTLSPGAFSNPATIVAPAGGDARSAFVAQVSGAARNQGVFVHDGTTLTPLALGCGALGGGGSAGACGDPTPLGGTFSGFFTGTIFAPAVNAAGDVLFMADVLGGAAPRGLFLFRAATGAIETVAAPGDASPLGGTFAMVGPGTLDAAGSVAFLASGSSAGPSDVFLWDGASVTKVAAAGDAAPLGSTYQFLGTESFGFADGTTIPVGPVPDLADDGSVVFRAITADGRRGIVRRTAAGTSSWLVRDLEATPAGGTFLDFQAASANAAGEIAFFADVRLGPSAFTAGWFVGTSGSWRAALVFGDAVGGGTANGLAFSRNPMTPLDDDGNVLVWTDVLLPGGTSREHLVVSAPDGALTVVARQTDATPLGGTYGTFDAWPSLDPAASGRGAFGASTPASGVLNAHFLFEACPAASATFRNGSGANAACFSADPPVLGAAWTATVDASAHPGAFATVVIARAAPLAGLFVGAGEILLDPTSLHVFTSIAGGSGLVAHLGVLPSDPALAGLAASLQGLVVGGGAELCNAVDVVLGY
jgi:hypothetical protein